MSITMTDHFRIGKEAILALIFIVFLIAFAGKNGLRAIYSFAITIMTIWKILVPSYLGGVNPLWVGIGITTFLTVIIIWLVYGFETRTLAASGGAILGVLVTCVMGIIFTNQFQIHGSVMDYSETLLYAGFQNLNLTQIFMSSIFIGASGAMIDLSVDITSAVHEVVQKKTADRVEGSDRVRHECGKSRDGDDDDDSAAGLFRRLHCAFDGVYGAGNPNRSDP